MKKSDLKQIIKEELIAIREEDDAIKKDSSGDNFSEINL